jgi:ketosteroid isomerase-like protein
MSQQHKKLECFALCLIAALLFAGWAGASDKQKNKKNTTASDQPTPLPPVPDTDQIEHDIGEMLGAFQLGDVETMHKHYADNVTFVSGDYAPPIVGWQSYAALYESQRAAFQGMQLVRSNTLIITHTDVAWAMYQWEFMSSVNGKPFSLRGQTTLILNKVGGNWLIVHNHTSGIYPQNAAAAPQQTATVTKP